MIAVLVAKNSACNVASDEFAISSDKIAALIRIKPAEDSQRMKFRSARIGITGCPVMSERGHIDQAGVIKVELID
jgi:hypothetical protein